MGVVVRSPLTTGQPITEASIVRAGSAGFLAATVTPGMRAVSIPVTTETGAGGFILPNDRVDIISDARYVAGKRHQGFPIRNAFARCPRARRRSNGAAAKRSTVSGRQDRDAGTLPRSSRVHRPIAGLRQSVACPALARRQRHRNAKDARWARAACARDRFKSYATAWRGTRRSPPPEESRNEGSLKRIPAGAAARRGFLASSGHGWNARRRIPPSRRSRRTEPSDRGHAHHPYFGRAAARRRSIFRWR